MRLTEENEEGENPSCPGGLRSPPMHLYSPEASECGEAASKSNADELISSIHRQDAESARRKNCKSKKATGRKLKLRKDFLAKQMNSRTQHELSKLAKKDNVIDSANGDISDFSDRSSSSADGASFETSLMQVGRGDEG